MTKKEKLLIVDVLEKVSEVYGTYDYGGDDYDLPDNWTQEEKDKFYEERAVYIFGKGEGWREFFICDYDIMAFLAYKLKKECEDD